MTLHARILKPATRIHMDVAATLLKDSDNRGIIIIVFGESGYEITAAAASHEEGNPLARVAGVLKDMLKNADIAREVVEDMVDARPVAQPTRLDGPEVATGMGVEGSSE